MSEVSFIRVSLAGVCNFCCFSQITSRMLSQQWGSGDWDWCPCGMPPCQVPALPATSQCQLPLYIFLFIYCFLKLCKDLSHRNTMAQHYPTPHNQRSGFHMTLVNSKEQSCCNQRQMGLPTPPDFLIFILRGSLAFLKAESEPILLTPSQNQWWHPDPRLLEQSPFSWKNRPDSRSYLGDCKSNAVLKPQRAGSVPLGLKTKLSDLASDSSTSLHKKNKAEC